MAFPFRLFGIARVFADVSFFAVDFSSVERGSGVTDGGKSFFRHVRSRKN